MFSILHIKEFALFHADIAYTIIALGVFMEGEIMVIIAGIFSHLGSFKLSTILLVSVIGCGLKSFIGYNIGFYLNKYHSHLPIVSRAESRIKYSLPSFESKPFLSLFLSRFLIFGIYWFSLIYAGYKNMNIKTFIRAEIASFIPWFAIMFSLGYFFSYTALSVSNDIRKFLGLLLVFFIGFFILEKVISFIIKLFENKQK